MPVMSRSLAVRTTGRGFHEITAALAEFVATSRVEAGVLHVFCQHTSASLMIMENADPSARADLERWLTRLVRDGDPLFEHSEEGPDDMSAHVRMALTRTSETLPVAGGSLALGTWQGVFLWEHRIAPHRRRLQLTLHW